MNTYASNDNATLYLTSTFGEYLDYCNFTAIGDTTTTTTGGDFIYTPTGTSTTATLTNFVTTPTSTASTLMTLMSANSTIAAAPTTATNDDLTPTAESTATQEANSSIRTWIAGPIVGSIAGVAILALLAYLVYRRRSARGHTAAVDYTDKPQLHSDCVQKSHPSELDTGMMHELPGDEARDDNTFMTELPGEDSGVQDKKFGSQRPLSELPG